jgi:hypothetical protein
MLFSAVKSEVSDCAPICGRVCPGPPRDPTSNPVSIITLVGVFAAALLISGRPEQSARPAAIDDAAGTQPAAPGGEAAPAELEPAGV